MLGELLEGIINLVIALGALALTLLFAYGSVAVIIYLTKGNNDAI